MFCLVEVLLGDFLIAENSPFQSDVNTPVLTSERASNPTSPTRNNLSPFDPLSADNGIESPSSGGVRLVEVFNLKFILPTVIVFSINSNLITHIFCQHGQRIYGQTS